jgi:hypothetical protein
VGDLTAPRWKVGSAGRIQIESKDDIRKRLGRSTDAGDAVVQAFHEPWLGQEQWELIENPYLAEARASLGFTNWDRDY